MQTVQNLIGHSVPRLPIWVYTVFQDPVSETLDMKGLSFQSSNQHLGNSIFQKQCIFVS